MATTFGERLKEARLGAGLSVSNAAKQAGSSPASFYAWEAGSTTPRNDTCYKLAKMLGVRQKWLQFGVGEMTNEEQEKAELRRGIALREKTEFTVRGKDKRIFDDLDLVIRHLKDMDLSRDEKEACFETLSELRNDYERRVVLGVRPTTPLKIG